MNAQNLNANKAIFEPEEGQFLFFVGQDLNAIGGLEDYNTGYVDYFDTPAGITLYTNLSPGAESYSYYNQGLDGLTEIANWGAGDSCVQCYLENSKFNKTSIAIGLSFVNNEKKIAQGKHDTLIKKLALWIKESKRPIFLRIGYEFDGWDWNHYRRKPYIKAWRRIHEIFMSLEVTNVAFVWQSKGTGSDHAILEKWYPGDDIVDWCAYSYFGNPDLEMISFARKHKKPVFIAEATPVREVEGLFFDTDLKRKSLGEIIWKQWYEPFFRTIEKHQDVIKAFSYINADWSSQPMWINNPLFKNVDSRIQVNSFISEKWKKEINKHKYLKSNDYPFKNWVKD